MSCNYSTTFDVAIRPEAVESLAKAINVITGDESKSKSLGAFELHGDTLCCVFSGLCSFEVATAIETFTKGAVSDAAAESIVVTEETDGEKKSYGIGPDGKQVFSAHCRDEIVKLAGNLTAADCVDASAAIEQAKILFFKDKLTRERKVRAGQ